MLSRVWQARGESAARVALLTFLWSCAANRHPSVIPELLAGKPVCLTVDWGSGGRPGFSGGAAPDTLLLLPERGGRPGIPANADSRGMVTLGPSQREREGGGWTWWTKADTLVIRGWSVTEEDLELQTDETGSSMGARWAEGASRRRGTATLQPYKCTSSGRWS